MSSPLGTVQSVIVCVPAESGIQGACPAGSVQTVTAAYLVSPTASETLDLIASPINPADLGAVWGFAFASTVFLWLVSLSAGAVIRAVKSA